MKLNLIPANLTSMFVTRVWTLLMSVLLLVMMSACGGGNGPAGAQIGTGGGTTTNGVITLQLTNSANVVTNTIPPGGSLIATAKVVDANGAVVANALVTFSLGGTAGSLPITTALTDSSGNAVVSLQTGTTAGAAALTAKTTLVGAAERSAIINFQSGATGATASPNIVLALVSSSSCTANTVTAACPITANATVTDASGAPVAGSIVTFANTLSFTSLSPTSGAVITNSSGVATVTLATNGLPTAGQTGSAGTVNASVTVGAVTVTAGQNYTVGNTAITLALNTPVSGSANVNAYGTTTIAVQVNSNGTIYTAQPVTVNFSSSCVTSGKATLPASATTANGIAQVTYTDQGCGLITDTVTASVAGVSASVTALLTVAAPTVASINFTAAVPSDESIVPIGTGGVGRTSTAILTFTVVDTHGAPIPNTLVNFSNNNTTVATLNTVSATTAADGTVSSTVTANNIMMAGTFAITASLASDPTVNAISNSIIVSTAQPVQASFSLSATVFNIEGWAVNGTTSTLTAYIADQNGNPVVDGTPVVATTDVGSVGNASGVSAGCTTVNGECSLVFKSQNPKSAGGTFGIATVDFSSTNSTTVPITGSIQLYLSDGNPYIYSILSGSWTLVGAPGIGVDNTTLASTNCSPNISLIFADFNGNPMPAGTSFSATTTTTGLTLGTIFPATNPSFGVGQGTVFTPVTPGPTPNTIVNGQNVVIPFTLASPLLTCNPLGTPGVGSFNFSVTTITPPPESRGVITNFVYTYPV